jgi:hypothetical protein
LEQIFILSKEKPNVSLAPMGMASFFFVKEKDIMDSGRIS